MLPQTDITDAYIFACQMCGECCSSWNIPLEVEKADILMQRDWFRERLTETHRELQRVTREHYRIPLTRENFCVFLGDDNRCMVEMHEGKALKPEQCKRFPFASVTLPSGEIRYDASATCKSIAETGISTFKPILPHPNSPSIEPERLSHRIKRSPFSTISLPRYLDYLEELHAAFIHPDRPPSMALKEAQQRLKALPGTPPTWKESLTFQPHPRWDFWIPIWFLRKPYGSVSLLALLREGEYRDPKLFESTFSLQGHSRIPWPGGELDTLLKAYLVQILHRKVLLSYGHHLEGILSLACVTDYLVRWYAKTFALLMEKPEPDRFDLTLAIRMTERYYTGHQPRFLEFFRTHPLSSSVAPLILGR